MERRQNIIEFRGRAATACADLSLMDPIDAEWVKLPDTRKSARASYQEKQRKILNVFMQRNFWSVILTAVVCILDVLGSMEFWLCALIIAAAGVFLVLNFMNYISQNQKILQDEERRRRRVRQSRGRD